MYTAHGRRDRRRRSRWSCSSTTARRPRPRSSPPRCSSAAARKVVGTHTYGKGVFQEIDAAVQRRRARITVGEFFTPNGTEPRRPAASGPTSPRRGITPERLRLHTARRAQVDTALLVAERTVAAEAQVSPQPRGAADAPSPGEPAGVADRSSRQAGSSSSPSRSSPPGRGSSSAATAAPTSAISSSSAPGRAARPRARGGGRAIARRLGRPDVARDVIEALMIDRGLRRGVRSGRRARGARRRGVGAGDASVGPADAGTCGICRRSRSIRRPRATSTTRSPRASERTATRGACGSTSPMCRAYVTPRSPIDREAYRRATSVYVPGAVEPMLPARAVQRRLLARARARTALTVTVEMVIRRRSVGGAGLLPLA